MKLRQRIRRGSNFARLAQLFGGGQRFFQVASRGRRVTLAKVRPAKRLESARDTALVADLPRNGEALLQILLCLLVASHVGAELARDE